MPSARRATVVTSAGSSLEPIFLSTPSARRATLAVLVESVKPLAEFLSTPSARRATFPYGRRRRYKRISIHALREEGDPAARLRQPERHISIHALREEGDSPEIDEPMTRALFLSTPSARRATTPSKRTQRAIAISIHALREEGDGRAGGEDRCGDDFYPRPPRGGRRFIPVDYFYLFRISIHALREEGDLLPECLSPEP